MKMRKLIKTGVICLLMIVLFAACNGGNGSNGGDDDSVYNNQNMIDTGGIDAVELIVRSAQVMQDVIEYDSTVEVDWSMEYEGESFSILVEVDINAQLDPLRMRIAMSMEDLGGMSLEMDTYAFHEGDYLAIYVYAQGMWARQTMPFSQELLDELMQMSTVEMMADLVTDAVIVGEEVINGIDTWKVEVVMSAVTMMGILQDTPGGESFADMFTPEVLAAMDDMASTLWIAKDGYYQVKAILDMTDAMAQMMAEAEVIVTNMTMIMTFFNFGNATPFELPPEAANAMELPM